ncbi:hypothetical protein [Glutamicibacter arilaitensis]|uniref:hypothetical protein n=1 Tax=Glutamicibacter arilaitensis TaxID=256701 RepID=UPI003A90231F
MQSIRKRAWLAVPNSTALLDIDLGLQIDPRGSSGIPYPRGTSVDIDEIVNMVRSIASLPVRLRSDEADMLHPLIKAGKPLAAHYASRTSSACDSNNLVKPGEMTAVIEAPGLIPRIPQSMPAVRLWGSDVQLLSLPVHVPGGGRMTVHVLWDELGSKGNRKRIREMRIHILRLHSIFELMRSLASPAMLRSPHPLSETCGELGFDSLQRTLLECVRIVNSRKPIGNESPSAVLDAAFFSRNFADRNLKLMLERMLGAMRPRVQREVEDFIAKENGRSAVNLAAEKKRTIQTMNIIKVERSIYMGHKYSINAPVTGPVGDNAKVEGNVIGGNARVNEVAVDASKRKITIGDVSVDSNTLYHELRALREYMASAEVSEQTESEEYLIEAENHAKNGNAHGVRSALSRAGTRIAEVAAEIGVPVAQAALKAAIGL